LKLARPCGLFHLRRSFERMIAFDHAEARRERAFFRADTMESTRKPAGNAAGGKRASGNLTARQSRFVAEYLLDLNATQAAVRAGYSGRTAESTGPRLLGKMNVAEAVRAAMEKRERRTGITQDRVLQELARIAFFDIRTLYREDGSLKKPSELDDDAAAALAGVDVVEMAGGMAADAGEGEGKAKHVAAYTKKARVFDKNTALVNAMRHLGMMKDKIEHSGNVAIHRLLADVDGSQLRPK